MNKSKFDVIFKIKNENNNIDVKIHYYLQYHKETFVNLVMRRERFVGLSSYSFLLKNSSLSTA